MIAAQFIFLASSARLDDLIALAEQFASDDGWSEGLVGVRRALRKATKAGNNESVGKLTKLEQKVAPRTLTQRIVSYVLPTQWSVLDLANVDFDDEQQHEKSWKKIDEVCEGIGVELAADLEALRLHLPKLLTSTSDRVFSVAKAVGRNSFDPGAAWKVIEDAVFKPELNNGVYTFPGGFLLGLSERDRAQANELLDTALAKQEWHAFLPHMQQCVGIDEAGSRRLIAAVSLPAFPAWTLRTLAAGRSTDDLGGVEFKALLAAIAAREDGLDAAVEILYMRLFSLRSDKKSVSEVEREVARDLLLRVPFDKDKNQEPHMLADIVRLCLVDPEDAELAKAFCLRLFDAIGEWRVSPWEYSKVVAELAGIFPRVVLKAALEPENAEARRDFFRSVRDDRPCPLRKIADNELLSWAKEKAETRFPAVAASIHGWRGPKAAQNHAISPDEDDPNGRLEWTPTAMRLIYEAPDPVAVLREFAAHFRPSGWSGSLANILSRREALLVALIDDPDQRIKDWARAAIPTLREEVERTRKWEADIDREQDERFEW